jgi:hypothetical protein
MAMNMDWIHDKYRASSFDHNKENVERSRKPEYYDRPTSNVAGTYSYKPSLGGSGDKASSRGKQQHRGDRSSVDKPTAYYTLHDRIIDKVLAAGKSPDSYCNAYYKYGHKVKDDKPEASAYWLLWRQECMIWKMFCM